MIFKITIKDRDNGNVQIDCEPNFEVMAKIAREKSDQLTPAAGYALGAIAYLKRQSLANLEEKLKDRESRGLLPPMQPIDSKIIRP